MEDGERRNCGGEEEKSLGEGGEDEERGREEENGRGITGIKRRGSRRKRRKRSIEEGKGEWYMGGE
jgi:hypothetical protein